MLSTSKRFLFVHVAKTGGNSLTSALLPYCEDEIFARDQHQDGVHTFSTKHPRYETRKHATLREYKDVIEPELFDTLFKFSIIRNPWDQLISWYFTAHRQVTEWDREQFVRVIANFPTLDRAITLMPVHRRVAGRLGMQVLTAPARLDADIDALIRFEALEEDFNGVLSRLGIEPVELPKLNPSDRKHYSVYYDDKLIDLVAKKFATEIAWGGYTFDYE